MTYSEFIGHILETRGRFECGEEYHERHHIVPRCMDGSDDSENLIDLFAEEHFIAHKFLAEENPDNTKLVHAYAAMAFIGNDHQERYRLTPEEYADARKSFSEMLKQKYRDKNAHPSYGTHISEERKRIIGNANRGNKYCVGRKISDETRKKIGDANRNPSEETRRKMSESQKGKNIGQNNPRAKVVIRLLDGKIYGCAKDAAIDNNINYSTFREMLHKKNTDFMYYKEWVEQNNLENIAC